MLLYAGLGLAALIIITTLAVRPLPPRTLYLDEGHLLISDSILPPRTVLASANRPVRDLDTLNPVDHNYGSDKLYTISRAKDILIVDAGKKSAVLTRSLTVGDLIRENPETFSLGKLDRVKPSLNTPLKDNLTVSIVRITVKEEVREEKVEPSYKIVSDASLPRGKMVTVDKGKPGLAKVTYQKTYENGKLLHSKKLNQTVIQKPVDGTKKVGSRVLIMSRSGYRGRRMLDMEATAYDSGFSSTGKAFDNITATGAIAEYGVVAVDPKVIPLGTHLFIEGYGYAVAKDVGGAIKGLRIDLFFESHREAIQFGRRHVKVYILD